jgi:parallel beta-helix repeat protein
MRDFGILRSTLSMALLLGMASPLWAQLACGGTVGPGGAFVLTGDLDCRDVPACQVPGGCSPVITVVGKAVLDLGGHRITCDSFRDDGVRLSGSGATLKNGQVNLCGNGVVLGAPGRHVVKNVVSTRSANNAFTVTSDGNRLENNVADTTGVTGFNLSAASRNTLVGNLATRTETFSGFSATAGSNENRFQDNVAAANASGGFLVSDDGNKLVGNTAIGNGDEGFAIDGEANSVKDNRAVSNVIGIDGDGVNNLIERNTALDNLALDLADGVSCENAWRRNVFGTSDQPCIQ